MQGYVAPLEALTVGNDAFRKVLHTSSQMQLVLMALLPGQEIGGEVHATHDQFFRIEMGDGLIVIDGVQTKVAPGDGMIVPAGLRHNLTNTGTTPMRLYTIYAPPEHADQLEQGTKAIADGQSRVVPVAVAMETARKDMIDEGSPVVVVAGAAT